MGKMSTIVVRYKPELKEEVIDRVKEELMAELMKVTAELLNKKEEEVIIELEPWKEMKNGPDILFRGETSLSRRPLLKEWARLILEAWRVATKEIALSNDLRVAAKTYVVDSEWKEI